MPIQSGGQRESNRQEDLKMSGYYFREHSLQEAGQRLRNLIAFNGPSDHLRIADACIASQTIEEARERVIGKTEFQIDADDAWRAIDSDMKGHNPIELPS